MPKSLIVAGRRRRWVLLLVFSAPGYAFTQDVVINEILASGGDLTDEDGERSDWIELHNPSPLAVDLDDHFLTDDAGDLTRWRFPALTLDPGGYLIVFASGKSRASTGGELHASFRLDGAGEYLALVAPDGVTVLFEFAPEFPPQRAGISYGLGGEVRELLRQGDVVDALVPRSGALGSDWTGVGFAPGAGWTSGPSGVGYARDDAERAAEGLVGYWSLDGTLEDSSGGNDGVFRGGAVRYVDGHGGAASGALRFDGADDFVEVTQTAGLPIYDSPAFSVALWVKGGPQADKRVFSEGSGSNNLPVFNIGVDVSGATGSVDIFIRDDSGSRLLSHTQSNGIAFDDTWHHVTWVDDDGAAELYIDGVADATDFSYEKRSISLDRTSIGAILRAGSSYHFDGDIDEVSVWNRALTPDEVAGLAAGGTPSGLGGAGLDRLIGTDVEGSMAGVNASVYVRAGFEVEDPGGFESLVLRMRYDDGFIAYLNGVEVARRNAPQPVGWTSTATAEREPEGVARAEDISLTDSLDLLLAGSNVLAIHGLNAFADDSEALVLPELTASGSSRAEPRYFVMPTPGEPNRGGVVGFVADTRFSVDRGFFQDAFEVEISCATPRAEIRYTLDGSPPGIGSGLVHAGPLQVDTTTVLRAAAFRDGLGASNVDTQTYIFPSSVLRQRRPDGFPDTWGGAPADYAMDPDIVDAPDLAASMEDAVRALPAFSIVMEHDDFFGFSGIYTNPTRSGRAWERLASAELIHADGRAGFQIDAGVRVTGNRSRSPGSSPKHGLRLIFRGEYGAPKLEYGLFTDSAVERFDTIVIKPNAFDSWVSDSSSQRRGAQYLRDQHLRDAQRDTGNATSHGLFTHLFINGLYWGVYNVTERPDASFASAHFGGDKESWDAVKNHEELVDGSLEAYRELDRLRRRDLSAPANYDAIREYLDVENMIDYMIVNMHAPATDWPGNYYMIRQRRPGAGFKFVSWDAEYAYLGGVTNNRTLPHRRDADSPTKFYHACRANLDFRTLFGDHLQRHFFDGGALTHEAVDDRWMSRAREIELALLAESARWGDHRRGEPYRPGVEWQAEQDYLREDYFPRRGPIVLSQFAALGLFPDLEAPSFNRNGGDIEPGFELVMTAPEGEIRYRLGRGDPRREGGAVDPDALWFEDDAVLVVDTTTLVKARARLGDRWSALREAVFAVDPGLRITEVMYHPLAPPQESPFGEDDLEFVEVRNTSAETVELSGVRITGGIEFDFTDSAVTELVAGEVVVVVESLSGFATRYDLGGVLVAGEYRGRLGNDGETLRLVGQFGEVILELVFDDAWHPGTDGVGPSLVIRDDGVARGAWSEAASWRPSVFAFGSPGFDEAGIGAGGRQLPGDVNQDGRVDVSDPVALLRHLFIGSPERLACGDGSAGDPANVAALDGNGDGGVNLSDAVHVLDFLFRGGSPPAGGTGCVSLSACPNACGD